MSTDSTPLEELARRTLWELSAEAAGIGTYVVHLPSGHMDMDERARELTGLAQATGPIRPQDIYAYIPAEEVTDVAAAVEHALATAGTYSAEHRLVYPDGSYRWVAARGQTLIDDAGAVTALVGALYDITALREATTQQAALVTIARALGEAETEADVLTVVAGQGARLMGANGGGLCLQESNGTHMRILTTDTYGDEVRHQLQRVPVDFPLPAVYTAATGSPTFHADLAETVAAFPGAEDIYLAADVQASAAGPSVGVRPCTRRRTERARSELRVRFVGRQVPRAAGFGLAVQPGDVGLELDPFDPPLPATADLHCQQRAVPHERVDLRVRGVQLVGDLLQRQEAWRRRHRLGGHDRHRSHPRSVLTRIVHRPGGPC
jgi:PAS domain S-box-containing protein